MARTRTPQKDILSRVQDLGSEALSRLPEIPGGQKLAEMANESRSRLDDMQKKLRGLEALEKRVAKLERELSSSGRSTTGRSSTTARKTTAASRTTARKTTSAAKSTAKSTAKSAAKTTARKTTARKASTPKKPPA